MTYCAICTLNNKIHNQLMNEFRVRIGWTLAMGSVFAQPGYAEVAQAIREAQRKCESECWIRERMSRYDDCSVTSPRTSLARCDSETSRVYYGSDGVATRKYLRALEQRPTGRIAAALFRAMKASARAKVYGTPRGAKINYRDASYRRKEDAIDKLCDALEGSGLTYGWGVDTRQTRAPWVIYIDLPTGQVSFHAPERGSGPDYPGEWDGVRGASEGRVIAYCESRRVDPVESPLQASA